MSAQQQPTPGDALAYLTDIAKHWLKKQDGPAAVPASVAVQNAVNTIVQALGLNEQPVPIQSGDSSHDQGEQPTPQRVPAMIPRSKKGKR